MVQEVSNTKQTPDLVTNWFDDFVGNIRKEQVLIQTGLASEEKTRFWNMLTSGNLNEINHHGKIMASIHFIKSIVWDFLNELAVRNCKPVKLAFDLSDSKVLVWAVINDDDEIAEDSLILAEAFVNARYFKYGFHVSSTILEQSDNYPIPGHYKSVLPN